MVWACEMRREETKTVSSGSYEDECRRKKGRGKDHDKTDLKIFCRKEDRKRDGVGYE